jgi:uncharacterized protein YegL
MNNILAVSKGGSPMDAKRASIEAARKAAASASGKEPTAIVRWIPPAECADRIRIVFDDSGSMSGQIEHAKQGVVEFLRNCIPNQTAVAVHFMNTQPPVVLSSDLPRLGSDIQERHLTSGGTPFFNTIKHALEAKPTLTRMVVFTDGSPTDQLQAEASEEAGMQGYYSFGSFGVGAWKASADVVITIAKATAGKDKCIPIDTVFFDFAHSEKEIQLLKYLSEQTGGYFLHFDSSKPNIWKQLKYLAPVNRLMLASESFRASVEKGA